MKQLLTIPVILAAVLWGWKHIDESGLRAASGSLSAAELGALAATVNPGEVVMYSITECPYCAQAKGWLNQNGFAFTECNMSLESSCESEFNSYGGNGTPYLVAQRNGKAHHMKDGFDSNEFPRAAARSNIVSKQ